MFKFLRRKGNLKDDNASDIITEASVNHSDSAPILSNNRRYDLSNSVHHDLSRNEDELGRFLFHFFFPFVTNHFKNSSF